MAFIKDTPKPGSSSDNNKHKQDDLHNETLDADHNQPPTKAASAQQLEDFGVRKPSWMQPETMPQGASGNASYQVAQKLGGNTRGFKSDSLLARKDVRALLFMDAVYSVWACFARGCLDTSNIMLLVFVAFELNVQ